MRHLTVSGFGDFLSKQGNRLLVKNEKKVIFETPLSRLRSVRIDRGVSLSSDLIVACALRGVRIFFIDWRGVGVAELTGTQRHKVVAVRKSQFECLKTKQAKIIAIEIIRTKIRNQRAVLQYYSKYWNKKEPKSFAAIKASCQRLEELLEQLEVLSLTPINIERSPAFSSDWKVTLLGVEGNASSIYWKTLREIELVPATFNAREGRGAVEITNAALNYGYAILQSYVHCALENAGFEIYAGLLHTDRPGKPSLVLDFMEEYRSWVVDRNIINLRSQLNQRDFLSQEIKKLISNAIDNTMSSTILFNGKKIKLENVLQRQAYRLSAAIVGEKNYRGLRFKW